MSDPQIVIDSCKQQMLEALPRAVDTLIELAEYADKESVRLAAAESLMERSGLPKRQVITHEVDQRAHDQAEQDALALIARLEENKKAIDPPQLSLEAVMVHEGEPEGLPVAAPDTYGEVIEATVHDPDDDVDSVII